MIATPPITAPPTPTSRGKSHARGHVSELESRSRYSNRAVTYSNRKAMVAERQIACMHA